jgi:hypothetical protein
MKDDKLFNKAIILVIIVSLFGISIIPTITSVENNDVMGWIDVGQIGVGYDVNSMAMYNEKLYAATDFFGNVYRYDGGTTWTWVGRVGRSDRIYVLQAYDGNLYAGSSRGYIYRYNGNFSWIYVGETIGGWSVMSMTVYQDNLYAGTYGGYVYRYDGGTTWTWVGNPGGSPFELWVCSLTVYRDELYAGKVAGFYPEGGRVYRYNGGTSWTYVGEPDGPNSDDVAALAVHDDALYAANRNGNISRYEEGTEWTAVGHLDGGFYWSLIDCNGKLYAGSNHVHGYRRETNWTDIGSPIAGEGAVKTLAVYNNKLYAAGNCDFNGHIYRYDYLPTFSSLDPNIE